jgi:hypothetical protein
MAIVELLNKNITSDRRLSSKKVYVVTAEVRVRKGVTLTVEDGATILIQNGKISGSMLRRAALIFDQGSSLRAKKLFISACGESYKRERKSDNGGLWFLGNYKTASKDGVAVKASAKDIKSRFCADVISVHYLGRLDPLKETTRTLAVQDDIDGMSILGVGLDEWHVSEVRSYHSADDGFDVTNSEIHLDRLKVIAPVEDGLNLSSSRLCIRRSLLVDVTKNNVADRDIFDFEADDGASFLEISQHCHVDIKGVFGDQVVLSSKDLRQPNNNPEARYQFKGVSRKAATLVYTISHD